MVKLAVSTSTELQKDRVPFLKQPLDDTYEVPLEKQTIVHLKQNRCCTRRTLGAAIAMLFILALGGAVVGVYLRIHPLRRQCIDWGPGCTLEGPPKLEHHHGYRGDDILGESGRHSGKNDSHRSESHSGEKGGDSIEIDELGRRHHGHHSDHQKGRHDGDQDHAGKGGPERHHDFGKLEDHDGYHPREDRPFEPRSRPKYRKYPPGPAGPQSDNDGHSGPKHHLPLP